MEKKNKYDLHKQTTTTKLNTDFGQTHTEYVKLDWRCQPPPCPGTVV